MEIDQNDTTYGIVQIHQVYEKWVSTVIYFTDCHESLVSDIVMGMQPFSAMKDDFIYCQHEIAAHVYFLMKGKVQLTRTSPLTKKEMRLTSHDVGEHFGEVRILILRQPLKFIVNFAFN